MTKVIKILSSAGFAAILVFMIASFAAIGPPGHNAKAASVTDQSMLGTSSQPGSTDLSAIDLTHPPNVTAVTFAMSWSTGTTTVFASALYVPRVTRYALVGSLTNNTNNSQVGSANGSVFESPASSTLSSNSQSGLALGADSALNLTSGYGSTAPSVASIQAISGQNSFIQSAIIPLCVLLSVLLVAVLALARIRPGYVLGTESSTSFGNGWISKRFGSLSDSFASLVRRGTNNHH